MSKNDKTTIQFGGTSCELTILNLQKKLYVNKF